jgi:glycosyltransferase involved in cell wall biosynthesis
MKVVHLSHSDLNGGAAIAAYRIHKALRRQGLDSTMAVNQSTSGDWTVQRPPSTLARLIAYVRPHLSNLLSQGLQTTEPGIHSTALVSSTWPQRLKATGADIINLHWVNGEMLSIADIGKLRKPVVWTLHDMWAFCGAEHYTDDQRWREGYWRHNRPDYEGGFDLNRWTWHRKRKHWRKPIQIVTPSQWLADCVSKSALMGDWPVTVIPNPIDTQLWQPVDKGLARQLLNLPQDVPLLLFGAGGGTADSRKGFDLLTAALDRLRGEIPGLELAVFGQGEPKQPLDVGFPVHYMGRLEDPLSLRVLYSAADAMVIPSRQDNLPNTGLEAHACGTPVIAFKVGGLPDIVDHLKTGYLAAPFDIEDLARGVQWVLAEGDRSRALGEAARQRALSLWAPALVGNLYFQLYSQHQQFSL